MFVLYVRFQDQINWNDLFTHMKTLDRYRIHCTQVTQAWIDRQVSILLVFFVTFFYTYITYNIPI